MSNTTHLPFHNQPMEFLNHDQVHRHQCVFASGCLPPFIQVLAITKAATANPRSTTPMPPVIFTATPHRATLCGGFFILATATVLSENVYVAIHLLSINPKE
jgi:hypothetical protein